MSRIGKNPIIIPSDVKVKLEDNSVIIDGPKGSLIVSHDSSLKMKYEENTLMIERPTDSRIHKSLHGTTRQLVFNAVQGNKEGFTNKNHIINKYFDILFINSEIPSAVTGIPKPLNNKFINVLSLTPVS